MRRVRHFLLGLAVLGGVGYGLFKLIQYLFAKTATLDPAIQGPLIVTSVTLFGSVLTLALSRWLESRAVVRAELRKKKSLVYEAMIKGLFKLMFAEKMKERLPEEAKFAFFVETMEQLTIWGSDEVVKEFRTFRAGYVGKPEEVLRFLGDLLLAVREDLGHPNAGVDRRVLLGLFIDDVDAVLDGRKALLTTKNEGKE